MRCPDENVVLDFAEGRLPAADNRELIAHVDTCAHCRQLLVELAAVLTPGHDADAQPATAVTRVARYLVVRVLGVGAMGVVYAAYDPELDRRVAVKVLRAELSQPALRARLLREAQAMARVRHPNVVNIHDVGVADEQVFVAMELVEGPTLSEWLRQPHGWREILAVFVEAGRGLAAAHAAGLVHRDFKPDNVLIDTGGRARVTDFGLARTVSAAGEPGAAAATSLLQLPLTAAGSVIGTPAYMAPEQIDGGKADERSDVFSFCVALHHAVVGARPFAGQTLAEIRAAIAAGRIDEGERADAPRWLRRAIAAGLREDRATRPPSMTELLGTLAADPSHRRRRWLGAAAIVLAVGAAGFGARALASQRQGICSGAADAATAIWNPSRRAAIERSFGATGDPRAEKSGRYVATAASGYVDEWSAQRTEACEATRLRGEQSEALLDKRVVCLDQRLRDLDALLGVFAHASTTVVQRARDAVDALPRLASCANGAALSELSPRPGGDAARRLAELEERLSGVKAGVYAGQWAARGDDAERLVADAEQLGYQPLLAEALLFLAKIDGARKPSAVEDELHRAARAATAGHADDTLVRAWGWLGFDLGLRQNRIPEGRRWLEYAGVVAGRLGHPIDLEAGLAHHSGVLAMEAGDVETGLAQVQRAQVLVREMGKPESALMATAVANEGRALHQLGRYREAIDTFRRALDLHLIWSAPGDGDLSFDYAYIGDAEYSLRNYAEALRMYQLALGIAERASGPDSFDAAECRATTGELLRILGRRDEARRELVRAADYFRKESPRGRQMGGVLCALAQLALDEGKPREALALSEQAIALDLAPPVLAEAKWTKARAHFEVYHRRSEAIALAREANQALAALPSPHAKALAAASAQWLAKLEQ